MNLLRLGSEYGGWTIVDDPSLQGSLMLSVGVGEDISFDVEIIQRYKMQSLLLDPTPRSISYFESIINNYGKNKSTDYITGGRQPIDSYDLSSFNKDTISFIEKAMWTSNGLIKFYKPNNPSHVSCSVYEDERSNSYFWVETITYSDLVKIIGAAPKIIKMDIEGAAFDVMVDMLKHNQLPTQILFELEEIDMYNGYGESKIIALNYLLESKDYKLVHRTKKEFTYFSNRINTI